MIFEKYVDRMLRKMEKTLEFYGRHIFKPVCEVENVRAYVTSDHLRLPPDDSLTTPIAPGTAWGEEYSNIWLKMSVTVPECAAGKQLCAIPAANAVEILCFKNGKPAGIINSKNQFIGGDHSVMFVSNNAVPGEKIDLAFECYAGHTCLGTQPAENPDADEENIDQASFSHIYNGTKLYVLDETLRDCVFDLSAVLQIARLNKDNYASQKAYQCLKSAFVYLIQDTKDASEEEITASAEDIIRCLAPALKKSHGDASRGKVFVIGHSHMDTAWLWPISETIRKCARTYSQALTLMDLYPDYTFIQSSALHLDWMRRYYPAIFDGIKQRVAEGRYEPNGGVWVECDCNITGGEAMARQFIYGQRFTRKYLNYTSDSFWLPDTFGYNAAIPQIMKQSGVKYFFTTKLGWNDMNGFPAGTFIWKGIDGSEVTCHLNATHSIPDPKTVTGYYAGVTDRRSEPARLAAYGFGDGGGGPTYGMLEYLKRVKDLEGMPEVIPGTASKFMQEIEPIRDTLPVCDGELYLELHRGTLTKQHDVKRNNRLAEIALHDLELSAVLAGKPSDEKTEEQWKVLLKNQFHDILPGTCIPRVYEIEVPEMNRLISDVKADTNANLAVLAKADENKVSLLNTLSFDREDTVVLDGAYSVKDAASQTYTDLFGNEKTAVHTAMGALSASVLTLEAPKASASAFTVDGKNITTPYYKVTLDDNGYIDSLYDLAAKREVRNPAGAPLGTLLFGEEMPASWDNWDIDDDGCDKLKPLKCLKTELVSAGAVELRLRSEFKLGRKSSCVLDTVFYAFDKRVDYELKLDWHERHGLMKADFDVDIRSAFVKNEIQFGNIDRPTTRNNSIEAAKFEVCNHKYSDLSETRYGVSLLNDCKYGMSALGSDMRLTLIKGGVRPDFSSDFGVHFMRWSLLPHEGAFSAENTVRPAYCFNYLPVPVKGEFAPEALIGIDAPNIIAEAIKPAYDEENAYTVRLYECERSRTTAKVKLTGKAVRLTNFLEETEEVLPIEKDGTVTLTFHPFEIKTLVVER